MKQKYKTDLTGRKFNRLNVLNFSHISKNNGSMWNCVCECGKNSVVGSSQLSKGIIKSCGCLRKERSKATNTKHGMHDSPIYKRWSGMKSRCNDLGNIIYGGKGVKYDTRWEIFENFYEDMNEGFEENLELDRIDVNGDYCKENCRWVTHNENNFNKTRQSNNVSGKTGVSYRKDINKYRAYITVERKQISLGVYDSSEEAANARKEVELTYYGYYRDER